MSLPSIAYFYDTENNQLGSCFVNVGWFVTTDDIVDCLNEDVVKSEFYNNENTSYIVLYDIKIPKQLILDCSGLNMSDARKVIGAYISKKGII